MSDRNNLAVAYTRLSQRGESIDDQKDDIRKYCCERGFQLDHIYDDGLLTSGWDNDRPQFENLLNQIETNGDIGHVVVRDLSRFSRDRKVRLFWLLKLDLDGVLVHSVEDGGHVDLDEDWELTIQAMRATSDDVEKRKEIERSRKKTKRRIENGYWHGSPPTGTTFDDEKKYLVKGEDWDTVKRVLELKNGPDKATHREVVAEVDSISSTGTVTNILSRRDIYEEIRENGVYKS